MITGIDLPSVMTNISKVEFAFAPCTVDESTLSSTNMECTLDIEPTCGDHYPIITSVLGIVPVNETVTKETITCSISGLLPDDGVNYLGGDNLTISGQYLPHNLETSTISIKFSDS